MDFVRTESADKDRLAANLATHALRPFDPTPLSELVEHANGHGPHLGPARIPRLLRQLALLIEQGDIYALPENPLRSQHELFMPLAGTLDARAVHPVDHAVYTAARTLAAANDYPTLGLIDRELNRGRDEFARVSAPELLRALSRLADHGHITIGTREHA